MIYTCYQSVYPVHQCLSLVSLSSPVFLHHLSKVCKKTGLSALSALAEPSNVPLTADIKGDHQHVCVPSAGPAQMGPSATGQNVAAAAAAPQLPDSPLLGPGVHHNALQHPEENCI